MDIDWDDGILSDLSFSDFDLPPLEFEDSDSDEEGECTTDSEKNSKEETSVPSPKKKIDVLIEIDDYHKKVVTLENGKDNLEKAYYRTIAEDPTLSEYVELPVIFKIFNEKFKTWVDRSKTEELTDGISLKAVIPRKTQSPPSHASKYTPEKEDGIILRKSSSPLSQASRCTDLEQVISRKSRSPPSQSRIYAVGLSAIRKLTARKYSSDRNGRPPHVRKFTPDRNGSPLHVRKYTPDRYGSAPRVTKSYNGRYKSDRYKRKNYMKHGSRSKRSKKYSDSSDSDYDSHKIRPKKKDPKIDSGAKPKSELSASNSGRPINIAELYSEISDSSNDSYNSKKEKKEKFISSFRPATVDVVDIVDMDTDVESDTTVEPHTVVEPNTAMEAGTAADPDTAVETKALTILDAWQHSSNPKPEKETFPALPGEVYRLSLALKQKSPISALHELCSRLHWDPPKFDILRHCTVGNENHFWMTVTVNGKVYSPEIAERKKQAAKTSAARHCLIKLGILKDESLQNEVSSTTPENPPPDIVGIPVNVPPPNYVPPGGSAGNSVFGFPPGGSAGNSILGYPPPAAFGFPPCFPLGFHPGVGNVYVMSLSSSTFNVGINGDVEEPTLPWLCSAGSVYTPSHGDVVGQVVTHW